MSPGPGTIKDVHHQFKTNQKAQGTGPGTYDSFWNAYIYGTRFSPEIDDSPGPTTYSPKLPSNMPKYSMARRLTTPFYDCNPPAPKYKLYTIFHRRNSAMVKGNPMCAMDPNRKFRCEACTNYIRIDRQRERRESISRKHERERMAPPKRKRMPRKSYKKSMVCIHEVY